MLVVVSWVLAVGCSTVPEGGVATTFKKTAQTLFLVSSEPAAELSINSESRGPTPCRVYVQYGRIARRETENVTLWETSPEGAAMLTVLSLGLYAPFSGAGVAPKSNLRDTDLFEENEFLVELTAPGYRTWSKALTLRGEESLTLDVKLEPAP